MVITETNDLGTVYEDLVIDLSSSVYNFNFMLGDDIKIKFEGYPSGSGELSWWTLEIRQDATCDRTIKWPPEVIDPPELDTRKTEIRFRTDDGGKTVRCMVMSQCNCY